MNPSPTMNEKQMDRLDSEAREQRAASELAPPELQAQSARCSVATGSPAASSGDLLRIAAELESSAETWAEIIAGWKNGPSVPAWLQRIASNRHAANLLRAEAERLNVRQPQENAEVTRAPRRVE